MDSTYYLFHVAMGGFFSTAGNYTSEPDKAKTFPRGDAIELARKHLTNGQLGVIVVARADVEEVVRDAD